MYRQAPSIAAPISKPSMVTLVIAWRRRGQSDAGRAIIVGPIDATRIYGGGMIIHEDEPRLRELLATGCRLLAYRGLFDGVLGHISARVAPEQLLMRTRGPADRGLIHTSTADISRIDFEGQPLDAGDPNRAPNELPLHVELLRARPDIGAVVHAHPRAAVICTLAEVPLRPVFGAFNIPAMRLALNPIPVFQQAGLIDTPQLAREMVECMGESSVCLLYGHGITVAAETVESACVLAINLSVLLSVSLELASLGATPRELTEAELEHLPDLGPGFNDRLAWQAYVAEMT